MRKTAIGVTMLAGIFAAASLPAQAGGCCGAPHGHGHYLAPVPPYAVTVTTPTYVVRRTSTGQVVGQPMLVTIPTGLRPAYVVNQGQFVHEFDGIGAVPVGVPVADHGWGRFGFGYGYGYSGYYHSDRY